jgi:hypothetical protein
MQTMDAHAKALGMIYSVISKGMALIDQKYGVYTRLASICAIVHPLLCKNYCRQKKK